LGDERVQLIEFQGLDGSFLLAFLRQRRRGQIGGSLVDPVGDGLRVHVEVSGDTPQVRSIDI